MSAREYTTAERAAQLKEFANCIEAEPALKPLTNAALVSALRAAAATLTETLDAMETIRSAYEDQNLNHRDFRVLAGSTVVEVIGAN